MRDSIQFEHLTQVRPLDKHLGQAAVIAAKKLSQDQQCEELCLSVELRRKIGRVGRQRSLSQLVRSLRKSQG